MIKKLRFKLPLSIISSSMLGFWIGIVSRNDCLLWIIYLLELNMIVLCTLANCNVSIIFKHI